MRKQIDYSIKVNRAEWSDQSISGIANGVSFLIIIVINIYKDGAIKDHIKKVYSYLNCDVFHSGLKIVGITDIDNLNYMLGEYRNEIDHYKYLENSISSYASRQGISITKITWYLTYFTELALRTAFLDSIGFEVDDEIKSFAANDIVSWQLSQIICEE